MKQGQLILKSLKMAATLSVASMMLSACGNHVHNSGEGFSTGIIGGVQVTEKDPVLKSIVAVYDTAGKQLCTGSLIRSNVVLSAAHCIGEDTTKMVIIFGTDLHNAHEVRRVDSLVVHSSWASQSQESKNTGDMSLLHFDGELPAGYAPITILNQFNVLTNGMTVTLAGYGISDGVSKSGAGVLRKVNVTMENTDFSRTEMTFNQQKGKSACHGDSGGPALITLHGKNYLIGVTSRGYKDSQDHCDQFAVYTSALSYGSWIKSNVQKMETQANSNQETLAKN